MAEIFFHAFPNHFKGEGQPAFVGKNREETQKIAVWWKKDRKGRPFMAIRVDDNEPVADPKEEPEIGAQPEINVTDAEAPQDDGPEFLF